MNFILISIISVLLFIVSRFEATSLRCPKLLIRNGIVKYAKKNAASARIRCLQNYTLVGVNLIYCYHGSWDTDIPICVSKKPKCNKIESIPNGHVFMPAKYNNAVMSFSCNGGYNLVGADTIYCISTTWNSILPQCIKTNGNNIETSCDFESPHLCGWTQDINHDFDWKRENHLNTTGLFAYRPKYDNTFGPTKVGYYMYIETVAAKPGDAARLFSPLYNIENFTCFEFYYNMFGSKDGTLQVYIRQQSQNVEKIQPIFIVENNNHHVDIWNRVVVDLKNITEAFQIIIEGIRGYSFESNMAIDDVKLLSSCYDEEDNGTTEQIGTSTDMFDGLSCIGRCNTAGSQEGEKCQCNVTCLESNDCCPDYIHICSSLDDVSESTSEENNDQSSYWTKEEYRSTSSMVFPTTIFTSTPSTTKQPTKFQPQTSLITPTVKIASRIPVTSTLRPRFRPITQVMTTPTKKQSQIVNDVDKIPLKIDPEEEQKTEYELPTTSSYHWHVISFVSLVAVTIFIVITFKFITSIKKESNKNETFSESATDVRYLTSDEILNFTLATPSKDSDLLLEHS